MMRDFIRIRNVNQLEVIMKKSPQLKKTLIKLVLIIAPTLVNFVSSFNKYLQPGGERMMFIGIFENCDTTLKQNQTITDSMLCQKVIDETNLKKHEFFNFAVERGGYEINDLLDADDFVYHSYNFCSHEEAAEIAVNIK